MTDREKVLRDIETMLESIRIDRQDLANLPRSPAERAGILKHIGICMGYLEELRLRLDEADDEEQ